MLQSTNDVRLGFLVRRHHNDKPVQSSDPNYRDESIERTVNVMLSDFEAIAGSVAIAVYLRVKNRCFGVPDHTKPTETELLVQGQPEHPKLKALPMIALLQIGKLGPLQQPPSIAAGIH